MKEQRSFFFSPINYLTKNSAKSTCFYLVFYDQMIKRLQSLSFKPCTKVKCWSYISFLGEKRTHTHASENCSHWFCSFVTSDLIKLKSCSLVPLRTLGFSAQILLHVASKKFKVSNTAFIISHFKKKENYYKLCMLTTNPKPFHLNCRITLP